jgi:hypothetical protein
MVYTRVLYRYFRWVYILYSDSYLFLSKLYFGGDIAAASMAVIALENGWYSGVVFSAVLDFLVGSDVGNFADTIKLSDVVETSHFP